MLRWGKLTPHPGIAVIQHCSVASIKTFYVKLHGHGCNTPISLLAQICFNVFKVGLIFDNVTGFSV
jgi:hypothetical protein